MNNMSREGVNAMKKIKDKQVQNNLSQYPTRLNEREEIGKNKLGLTCIDTLFRNQRWKNN
jgi:hypothetical protein